MAGLSWSDVRHSELDSTPMLGCTSIFMAREETMTVETYDAIVVGAGAAGIGVGVTLKHAGIEDFLILDRHGVGASFHRWPLEMRFITPSFPTNSIGMLDLNSVAIGTSPAFSLMVEHPTGNEYARYLLGVAQHFELPVRVGTEIYLVERQDERFLLTTNEGQVAARHLIWAAGEFQYPNLQPFIGAEHCRHNSHVSSWGDLQGSEFIVIGGYESGVDAAIHLARLGKQVTVLDSRELPPWKDESSDPSISLSTYTVERLRDPAIKSLIKFGCECRVTEVTINRGRFAVRCKSGKIFRTSSAPILATGFAGSISPIQSMFQQREDGYPLLSDRDESTTTTGLFVVGPMVRHDKHVFCFIYKFRQRFAVVAKEIATRLGLGAEQLAMYRQWGMYLDDLSCCGEECVC